VQRISFAKGHATGNDFVLVPDLDDELDVSEVTVRALCDRHTGIGGNGLLRVVMRQGRPFMDYRNADGSLAEMCGNGIRVFGRYLVEEGIMPAGSMDIDTRSGLRRVDVPASGDVVVDMGNATPPRARAMPLVSVGDRSWSSTGVLVPNPHAVVFVDDLAEAGDLLAPPAVSPVDVFPDGVNVEFVVDRGPAHVAMRIHERGVGETLSCGTGACAVAWAARRRDGADPAPTYRIDVPGGTLRVTEHPDGRLELIGPAEIVARGQISPMWWRARES
jgi:diaminopimelate epimerase